ADVILKDRETALAVSLPLLKFELGVRRFLEDEQQRAGELASCEGAGHFVHRRGGGVPVARSEFVLFGLAGESDFERQAVHDAPLASAQQVFISCDLFGAEKVRQIARVVERGLPRALENGGGFERLRGGGPCGEEDDGADHFFTVSLRSCDFFSDARNSI